MTHVKVCYMVEAPNTYFGLKIGIFRLISLFLIKISNMCIFYAKTLRRFGYLVSSLYIFRLGTGFQTTDLSAFLT